jgi:hypothetical protein
MMQQLHKRSRIYWWLGHLAALIGVASFAYALHNYGWKAGSTKVILFGALSVLWFVVMPIARFLTNPDRISRRMSYEKWEMQWVLHGSVLPCLFAAAFIWMAATPWRAETVELTIGDLKARLIGTTEVVPPAATNAQRTNDQ